MPKIDLPTKLDRGLINGVLEALTSAIKNKHNDPTKAAAFDHAYATVLLDYAESRKDAARDRLLTEIGTVSTGYSAVLLAEAGVSCTINVSRGATRLDRKAIPTAIMSLGWKDKDGKLLTLGTIDAMLGSASTVSAPSKTIKSAVSSADGN